MKYRRRRDVLWRRGLDRVLICPRGADSLSVLSGTGVALWEILENHRTVDQLAEELAAQFGSKAGEIADDVQPVLNDLVIRRAIERLEP